MERGYLMHYGVKGQRWGVRRYQNADGSLTALGREHYGVIGKRAVQKAITTTAKGSKDSVKRSANIATTLNNGLAPTVLSSFAKRNEPIARKSASLAATATTGILPGKAKAKVVTGLVLASIGGLIIGGTALAISNPEATKEALKTIGSMALNAAGNFVKNNDALKETISGLKDSWKDIQLEKAMNFGRKDLPEGESAFKNIAKATSTVMKDGNEDQKENFILKNLSAISKDPVALRNAQNKIVDMEFEEILDKGTFSKMSNVSKQIAQNKLSGREAARKRTAIGAVTASIALASKPVKDLINEGQSLYESYKKPVVQDTIKKGKSYIDKRKKKKEEEEKK